jgi:hypothetical protein
MMIYYLFKQKYYVGCCFVFLPPSQIIMQWLLKKSSINKNRVFVYFNLCFKCKNQIFSHGPLYII